MLLSQCPLTVFILCLPVCRSLSVAVYMCLSVKQQNRRRAYPDVGSFKAIGYITPDMLYREQHWFKAALRQHCCGL